MAKHYVELASGTVLETENPAIWPEAKVLKRSDGAARLKVEARNALLEMLKPGDRVYTVLRHVSASGMTRRIDLYTIKNNEPMFLSGYAAKVLGERQHKNGGIIVGGCGMDMGFHLVYSLSRALFPEGFIPKEAGRTGRNGSPDDTTDTDGGYALNHSWL